MSLLIRTLLLTTSLLLLPLTTAQSSNSSHATFIYHGNNNNQVVFALSADSSSGDLYFHLSSPQANTWVGVGIGSRKPGALMFIAYPASNIHDVTISPRIGTGNTEPTYTSDFKVEKVSGGGLTNANTAGGNGRDTNDIVADAVCRGCLNWNGGKLDLSNTKQPFIFAVGPVFPSMSSDSPSAGLSRHSFYGKFTMDMTAATSNSGASVPIGPYVATAASTAFNTVSDNDPAPRIHGLVMSVVFILLLPIGALLLKVCGKVKGHVIVQTIGVVLFCMAFAGGCVVSVQYNRSKSFNSAHQVIGILLLLAMLSQYTLGVVHHRIFKREQRRTGFGKVHRYLGPAVIVIGIINGVLGFQLGGAAFLALPYAIIVILLLILYTCISTATHLYRRRRNTNKNESEGYAYPAFGGPAPTFGPPAGAPPGGHGYSPAGYPPPYSQQDVPLTRFESSQRVDTPAVEARPMV